MFSGCQFIEEKNNNPSQPLKINLLKNDDWIPISRYVDSVQYIPLKTQGKILLSGKLSFKFTTHYILILDQNTNQVALFDRSGTFIRTIGRLGKGPEEYQSINGWVIDEENNTIALYDRTSAKLLLFTLDNKLRKSIMLDQYVGGIALTPDQKLLLFSMPAVGYPEHTQHIIVMDYEGARIYQSTIPFPYKNANLDKAYFYAYENKLVIAPATSSFDSLFYLTDQYTLEPHLIYEYEGKPDKHAMTFDIHKHFQEPKPNEFMFIGPGIETTSGVFIHGVFDRKMVCLFIDKKTGISYNLRYSIDDALRHGFYNDLDGGPYFYPTIPIDHQYAGQFFTAKQFLERSDPSSKTPLDSVILDAYGLQIVQKIRNHLTLDDDPVIMIARFKN